MRVTKFALVPGGDFEWENIGENETIRFNLGGGKYFECKPGIVDGEQVLLVRGSNEIGIKVETGNAISVGLRKR